MRAEIVIQLLIGGRVGEIHAVVCDAGGKSPERAIRVGQARKLLHPFTGKRTVLLSGILPPPDDNDLIILGFRAGNASVVKRGQEFAEGQIASAAKNSKGLAHSVFLHS